MVYAAALLAAWMRGSPLRTATERDGEYDFDLKWDKAQPETFIRAVRDQLGLELVPLRRTLEYVIQKSQEASCSEHPGRRWWTSFRKEVCGCHRAASR